MRRTYLRFITSLIVISLALFSLSGHSYAQGELALPQGYDDTADEARYRKALEYFAQGVAAQRAELPREALRMFDRALRFDPDSREIRMSLVFALSELGDFERARTEALLIYPHDAQSLRMLSDLYAKLQMLDSTVYYLHLLIEVDTTELDAVRRLATYYQRSGQSDSALVYFKLLADRAGDYRSIAQQHKRKHDKLDWTGRYTRDFETAR
jgi:tetratricopeptide (TPR) repeat protein